MDPRFPIPLLLFSFHTYLAVQPRKERVGAQSYLSSRQQLDSHWLLTRVYKSQWV